MCTVSPNSLSTLWITWLNVLCVNCPLPGKAHLLFPVYLYLILFSYSPGTTQFIPHYYLPFLFHILTSLVTLIFVNTSLFIFHSCSCTHSFIYTFSSYSCHMIYTFHFHTHSLSFCIHHLHSSTAISQYNHLCSIFKRFLPPYSATDLQPVVARSGSNSGNNTSYQNIF
jgi:hypothetical protein